MNIVKEIMEPKLVFDKSMIAVGDEVEVKKRMSCSMDKDGNEFNCYDLECSATIDYIYEDIIIIATRYGHFKIEAEDVHSGWWIIEPV